MSRKLERYVGVSVATMDYLSNIKDVIDSPVAISEKKSAFIASVSIKNELTGLFTREVFDLILEKEFNEVKRSGSSLCILMLDVDDFKKVNDEYGHTSGDQVLKQIGTSVLANIRKMDTAARYGGEEIAVIMPGATINDAAEIAQRLREPVLNEYPF